MLLQQVRQFKRGKYNEQIFFIDIIGNTNYIQQKTREQPNKQVLWGLREKGSKHRPIVVIPERGSKPIIALGRLYIKNSRQDLLFVSAVSTKKF